MFTILQPIYPAGEGMRGDVFRGARSRLPVTPSQLPVTHPLLGAAYINLLVVQIIAN